MARTRTILVAAALVAAAAGRARADGGWQPPDTLAGLVGSYARSAITPGDGQIAWLTLAGSDGYRAQGPYTRFVDADAGTLTLQGGTYQAIASNPAIGAVISFFDERGAARDSYFILGIQRDPLGQKIVALQLVGPGGDAPIVLHRVGL